MRATPLSLLSIASLCAAWLAPAQAETNVIRDRVRAAEAQVLEQALGPDRARAAIGAKIVGGTVASPGEWPWQVGLLTAGIADNFAAQFCGGTLIAESWVVTAAHCVEGTVATDIQVLTGTNKLDGSGVRRPVVQIIRHPAYCGVPCSFDNDIALLRLGTSADEKVVKPLKPGNEAQYAPVGALAWATGWGNTSKKGSAYPISLMEVEIPIVSNAVCNAPQSYDGAITERMLCAGLAQGGKDTCQGDSGGPLVTFLSKKNGKLLFKLTGVVSWGGGCAQPNLYGVYTRVSKFDKWIAKAMH